MQTRVQNTNQGGRVRGRGRRLQAKQNAVNQPDNNWEILEENEQYHIWIKNFSEQVGFLGDQNMANAEPLEFLSLFLDDEFWELLTLETNRYAKQFFENAELKPNSRFHKWYEVETKEMKAFMALHLSMGLVEKPEIEDYWAEFWLTATPGFGLVMPRNRFEMILSFLHFANNENRVERGQPGYDRIFKIRPILTMILPKFEAMYGPEKELSLDEMTIAFKGRHTLKQYNPKKPDKYGYKAFVLSESDSGNVLKWTMYTGRNEDVDDNEDVGATHLIVRDLMVPYTGKGHEVYMDSYYAGPAIANELAGMDTGLCGTVNCNRRGMPKELRPGQLPLRKGDEPVFMRNNRLLACAWHDTKRVTMLSSIHDNSCLPKRIRSKESEGGFRAINKPTCVERYNSFMGGVDTADQRMKTYLFPHRSRKWYNRIFNAILSISVVNSHIIYRKVTDGPTKPLKVFIQDICIGLLEGYAKKDSKVGRPSSVRDMPQRLTERHWLDEVVERPDCVVCSDRSRPGGRRQTRFRCRQCSVALCAVPCNERFHTLKHYKQCHLDR